MRILIMIFTAVFVTLQGAVGTLLAQDAPSPVSSSHHVGEEFTAFVGQPTNNVVTAREVSWSGTPWRKLVFFSKDAREAVVASSTNQVCFFRGKLFAVYRDIQAFWIVPSESIKTNELTSVAAVRLADQSIRAAGFGAGAKRIDLAKHLEIERERRLAQMLILRTVEIKAERGHLVVAFESHTGISGKATLNESLELVAAEVNEPLQK